MFDWWPKFVAYCIVFWIGTWLLIFYVYVNYSLINACGRELLKIFGVKKETEQKRPKNQSDRSLSGAFRAQGHMRKFGIKTPKIMRSGRWW